MNHGCPVFFCDNIDRTDPGSLAYLSALSDHQATVISTPLAIVLLISPSSIIGTVSIIGLTTVSLARGDWFGLGSELLVGKTARIYGWGKAAATRWETITGQALDYVRE